MRDCRFLKRTGVLFLILNLLLGVRPLAGCAFAQDSDISVFSKEIIETKDKDKLLSSFEGVKDIYFKDNKYNDFVVFLESLGRKKRSLRPYMYYYTALSRFYQLRYLEETQEWNEYFANKDSYHGQLLKDAQDAIKSTGPEEPLHIYARLLLCRYYHGLWEDDLTENCLLELMDSAQDYAKDTEDFTPLKDIADQLMSDGNKSEAKRLYSLFVEGVAKAGLGDTELESMAEQFYEEQQFELAEIVYDLYLSRIRDSRKKGALIAALKEIAKKFAYKDLAESDPFYAEKIFKELDEAAGIEAFDQELIYLRAFNLEKMHEYPQAREIYADLVELYPADKHADEANFKIGVIDTYVLDDSENGKKLFKQLAKNQEANPWVAASLYQLGLLAHWGEQRDQAKSYYDQVITSAKDDTLILAQQRLRELEEKIPMEYNLKTFLDVSLKNDLSEVAYLHEERINLRALPPKKEIGGELDVESLVAAGESGCTQIELIYLWSGYLGDADPSEVEPSFFTKYQHHGSKVINLVVVNPSGIVDYGIEIVDIY